MTSSREIPRRFASITPWSGFTDTWGNFHGLYRSWATIEQWTEPTTAMIHRQFVRIPGGLSPNNTIARFKPLVPFRLIAFNDERGKQHVFEIGTQGVAEPTEMDRWMGEIWEVRNTYVQPSSGYGPAGGVELNGNGFMGWNMPSDVNVDPVTGYWTGNIPAGFLEVGSPPMWD
jgi:hypothetical protein